jgi:uncharacterized damage-inducible protein DinB
MTLQNLMMYHRWAVTRTLESCADLEPAEYLRDLGGSFNSVRDTLAHGLMADSAWLARVRDEPFTRPTPEQLPADLETLSSQWQVALSGWEAEIAARDSSEVIAYHAFNGQPFSNQFEEIVQHIVNHGSYHRGQVALMLRQLGHTGINTDLIAFTRLPA